MIPAIMAAPSRKQFRSKTKGKIVTNIEGIHDVTIFAVKRPGTPSGEAEAANVRRALTWLQARGVKCLLACGAYKGVYEITIAAFPKTDKMRDRIAALAFCRFDQESVLHLGTKQKNGQREAVLEYSLIADNADPRRSCYQRLGFWCGVSAEEALAEDAFTFVPSLDQYYIAKRG